ncbi:Farnesoate epoxidase [Orchesella cincta]|uniref:Farnesoate epoxidase n=1 Tax=Orchesella cincta TaxID=48709 RepID=A0A1D2NA34_ORCCI|nr:Farnesoate epoxidase [Orchesella cincta]
MQSLISSEGEIWEQQRRYVLKQLRDFGFGKSSMESVIIEEVNDLSRRLVAFNSEPVEGIKNKLSLAVVNSLWNIVAGTRYNQDNPKLRQIAYQVTGAFEEAAKSSGLLATVKWIKYVMPELSGYNAVRRAMNDIVEFVSETIKQHQATYQEDSPRDFIDAYLAEIKSTTDPQSSFYGKAAGIDTTSTTLDWAILYLAKQPEILKKLQKEIDEITGNARQVSFSDRPKMPYTLAVINELLRISIVPFGAPHRVIFDTEFKGVFFPKDTFIFINMHYMHHDPKLWEDPDSFRPERFLSMDEKTVLKIEYLNPFLIGRRQCPGESLAKDTVFLFLTNLVQRFDIMKDPSSPEPTTEPAIQFTITTQPYKVIFNERNLV